MTQNRFSKKEIKFHNKFHVAHVSVVSRKQHLKVKGMRYSEDRVDFLIPKMTNFTHHSQQKSWGARLGRTFHAMNFRKIRKKNKSGNILFDYFQMRGERKRSLRSPFKWENFSRWKLIYSIYVYTRICLNFHNSDDFPLNVFLLFRASIITWQIVFLTLFLI